MKVKPLLSISIVSHGQTNLLKRLMESIKKYEETGAYEFVLTENLEEEGNSLLLMRSPSVKLTINERQLSFAANHNNAFRRANGDFFCVLNPDVLFAEEVFPTLLNDIDQGKGDIVAPLVVDSNQVPQDSFRALPTPSEITRRTLLQSSHAIPRPGTKYIYPDWVAAIFLLMPSEVFAGLNGFDERYRLYFEDVDFCTRARLRGFRVLVNSNHRVLHDAARTSHQNAGYLIRHFLSALRFFTSGVYWKARKLKPGNTPR